MQLIGAAPEREASSPHRRRRPGDPYHSSRTAAPTLWLAVWSAPKPAL